MDRPVAKPIRTLHVDDEPDYLSLASDVLESEFEELAVDTCTTAEEGLERLVRDTYDAVIVDYRLPGMDGLEFLKRVREFDEEIPVVFLTGLGSEEVASEAITAGATDYHRKESGTDAFVMLGNRVITLVLKRRAEQEAAAMADRVREVYERVAVGFFALDDHARFTYINEEAADLFGVDPAGALGTDVWTAVPDLSEGTFRDRLEMSLAENHHDAYEARLPGLDRVVEVSTYPDETGVSVFIDDVTDAFEARAELEATRERLELTEEEFRVLREKLSRPPRPFH